MQRRRPRPARRPGPPAGLVVLAALLLAVAACRPPSSGEPSRRVVVFAAASLTDVLEVVADSFELAYPGTDVVVNAAASSLLARQIDEGAGADVFFSADEAWMDHLESRGRVVGPVLRPLSNDLVVAGRGARPPRPVVDELLDAGRLALGDPSHVPAGRYARQALECLGAWERLEPRVVPMLDVRAALLAVARGAADLGIVYASDVRAARGVRSLGALPAECQPEIRYAAALVEGAASGGDAGRFLAFATAPERSALWAAFGFEPLDPASLDSAPNVPAP